MMLSLAIAALLSTRVFKVDGCINEDASNKTLVKVFIDHVQDILEQNSLP